MVNFEESLKKLEEKRKMEREQFLDKCMSKIDNGDLAYNALLLLICQRFDLSIDDVPEVAHILVKHFVNNVDEDFLTWINKNDAPFVRELNDVNHLFYEFDFLDSEYEIVKLANKIYDLDLMISDYDYKKYVYSFSFDFNSFTPINLNKVRELKNEIKVLEKHNVPCSHLKEELGSFGLSDELLELI